ncbi:MAG: PAS domain-containing protein [Nitrospirae bacterium]|nr:PAS domain-containing protein [Nitrospirota bacterium]
MMDDKDRTKEDLINELAEMRLHIAALESIEETLRTSEERARVMLLAMPDLMFRLDRNGVFLDYKAERSELYAQSEDTIIGKKNRDISPLEFSDLIEHYINAALATGEMQIFEYQLPIPGRGLHDYEARMVASGADEVIAIVRDLTERKKSEKAIMSIAKGISGIVGEKFFNSLVEHLANILEADYAYIAEIVSDKPNHLRTFSFYAEGRFLDNMEVDIAGTPCEKVEGSAPRSFPSGIQKLFPKAFTMAHLDVDAYSGIELKDSSGKRLGLMAVMRKKPFEEISIVEMVLKIFAVRASSELERRKAEDALIASEKELKKHQASLELKNLALREMLIQLEFEKNKLQKNIDNNVEKFILPVIQKLEMSSHAAPERWTPSFGQVRG